MISTETYHPSQEIIKSQQEFSDARFGIFLHWGIYSMFGQGEWYMNEANINRDEYAKVASGFYPSKFDAHEWVTAFKEAGAKYICFTTRHHDGFSMWNTSESDYNIVKATPFKRDIVKELADECHRQGIKIHLYYSHIDWTRDDYPRGRHGHNTGWQKDKMNWKSYYSFMNRQLTELLTNYGEIGAIWFDGWWDHDQDPTPFDWELPEQYKLIHSLQPSCLIGNNHHQTPYPGEDIQIFERDLPGENKAGYSGQSVSRLPLETCETMNGMWGYKICDQNYKDTKTLIHYLVGAAGKGANLLLNIGPQPNGELPATAVKNIKEMGQWLKIYGETIYGTQAGDFQAQTWGVSTRKGNLLFVHILSAEAPIIYVPVNGKVKEAVKFTDKTPINFHDENGGVILQLEEIPKDIDFVVQLTTK